MKRSNISNLIIIILTLTIILLISISSYYKNSLKKRLYEDAIIVNKLGEIRGDIQRYTKLKITNQNIKMIELEINNLFKNTNTQLKNENLIPKECQNLFFSNFNNLNKLWIKIKITNNSKTLINLSEKAWQLSNKIVSHYEKIHNFKFNKLIKNIDNFIYLSIIFLSIVTFIIYKKIKKGLEIEVVTDKLTGLYNRLFFNEQYKYFINNFKRNKTPFSMIIIDIDNFKKINDTYGHKEGDEILTKIGDIIKDSIRRSDLAFRYGGEEFIVLLPNTKLNEAIKIANRIKNLIPKKIQLEGQPITISGGVGEYNGENPHKFFEKVDEALYKAKQNGKNQIISI